jgi:hypothetical protein
MHATCNEKVRKSRKHKDINKMDLRETEFMSVNCTQLDQEMIWMGTIVTYLKVRSDVSVTDFE